MATQAHTQSSCSAPTYKPRDPPSTILHQVVREHLEDFLSFTRENYAKPLPRYVEREFRNYLPCGDPREGFARVRCRKCRHEFFVAWSCKVRCLCPSCSGRRMAAQAAHVVDKVLPSVPIRQWVVSFPYEMRLLLAKQSDVLSAVLRIVMRLVVGRYLKRARELGIENPKTGGLNVLQRFGGSLNFNPHTHLAAIDGVYSFDGASGAPTFHFIAPPTKQELTELVHLLSRRVTRMLERRGLIRDGPEQAAADENEQAALDACRAVSLRRARFERVDDQGQSQQQLFADQPSGSNRKATSPTAADFAGFSLEAGVAMSALNKAGRERLLRYCLRGPLALERLSRLRDGSIAYRTKYGRGQRTHLVMTPVEFLARLASLVPPPRIPLVRYFGVLAPNSPYRDRVVPKPQPHDDTHESEKRKKKRATNDPNESLSLCSTVPDDDDGSAGRTSRYIDWATLMKRTLER